MLLPQDQILDSEEDNFLHNALEGKLAKVDDTTDYLSVLLPSKLAIDIMAHISPRLLSLEDSFADLRCTCSAPPPAPPPAPAPPACNVYHGRLPDLGFVGCGDPIRLEPEAIGRGVVILSWVWDK
ncbi:hypothetical protein EDB86DRAFT_3078578 [Lactarius hatsudake]|nr:hypothetical protein EDB86DRAFT_3078578 [Lactarius hatsudake]